MDGFDMKANELVKKYGLDKAIDLVKSQNLKSLYLGSGLWGNDLIEIVESHELIEKSGGLDQAKLILKAIPPALEFYNTTPKGLMFHFKSNSYFTFEGGVQYAVLGNAYPVEIFGKSAYKLEDACVQLHRIWQAVRDVESCQ